MRPRLSWLLCLVAIVALGILSRVVHTGLAVFDKYAGDALYAAMAYAILRLLRLSWRATMVALFAMAVMTAIELFQLTEIPAHMLASGHLLVRICARLLGTQFSFRDLVAYAVGIGAIWLLDRSPAGGE